MNVSAHTISKRIGTGCLILDGATGTELQRRGLPPGVCPELWCLDNPRTIATVHEEYRAAGADIIYTATFGANRLKLSQFGTADARIVNRELARLARRAVGRETLVAGSLGPTGHFVEPFGALAFEEAVTIFKEQIRGLTEGGVDLLVIETMMDIQEARAALLAARETTDLFTLVTMTFEEGGLTLNGTDAMTALVTLQSLGAHAVGCNCSTGPAEMIALIAAMQPLRTVPLAAKPNAGMPRLDQHGSTVFSMSPEAFASCGRSFVARGVGLIGGCCGTTPAHIAALRAALAGEAPPAPERTGLGAVSSSRRMLMIEGDGPLKIIGERINPTGKPDLQEELRHGRMTLAARMARDQEAAGASLLDVNVGVPGIDQPGTMHKAVTALSVASTLPLVIDASDPAVIEAGLRAYPGRALINSISGEASRMEPLLDLARRYGAMFVLLPLTGSGVPETAEEKKTVIRTIYREARRRGFTKADVVIDGLVMTVSSQPSAAMETLKTIEWASRTFRCSTLLGVSNVSFGLPERSWVNAAFLAMARSRGLTLAIVNPSADVLMHIRAASDLLTGGDPDASIWCSRFSSPGGGGRRSSEPVLTTADTLRRAVLEGSRESIVAVLEQALREGSSPESLLSDQMIPAITEVGSLYERKHYFLPQLIAAAETMQRGVVFLEPLIAGRGKGEHSPGTIVMATVEGDIHDIGKNIVILMLKNRGYRIIDMGKDVPAVRIVEEARRVRADLVGLSALMTTTMAHMESTVLLARQEGLSCPFMVGGAVVTASWASSIGAHYARDGVEAVRLADRLLQKREDRAH